TRGGWSGLLGIGGTRAVNGKSIVVAVVDSGINTQHTALANRVIASVSKVTGDSSTADAFGHGTHVAGIIAGAPTTVTPLYTGGIAPGAQLVNVRGLGANGSGLQSGGLAGHGGVIHKRSEHN